MNIFFVLDLKKGNEYLNIKGVKHYFVLDFKKGNKYFSDFNNVTFQP